jgi:nitrite reductase/ring-hydroxylating ferredoxin subunit
VLEPVASDGTVRALAYDESVTNIVCSWHGYEFDLKTGANQGYDKIKLRKVKLEEKDGHIYVVV